MRSISTNPVLPSVQLRRNMACSSADASAYGVMVGVGETFVPAFALAIGLGEVTAGLVASVPLMAGGLLQLASLWALRRGVSDKWWVVFAATIQGLSFLPLIAAAIVGSISSTALLLIATIYWAAGLASGPAWNCWIERLIPRGVRAGYFAKRTRASQIATLSGFVAGGLLLQYGGQTGRLLHAFALLFSAALLFRLASAVALALHREPRATSIADTQGSLLDTPSLANGPGSANDSAKYGKQLLIYLVLVQGMVQLSGPYFTPYMLQHLQLSYVAFTGLVAVAFISKIVSLLLWGRFARTRGASWLLMVGGTAIVPLSALWVVSESIYWLIFIQTVNGAAWAAYELGFFLMFFETLPRDRRIKMLTYYNVANTSAWCIGATVGAVLLKSMSMTVEAYYTLFILSSLGRVVATIYLYATRRTLKVRVVGIGLRILGVRPSAAPIESPILPSIPEMTIDKKSA